SRLKLPAFTTAEGGRKFKGYEDFIINWETAPGSGIGFLSGWRGVDGDKALIGEPNPKQWQMYAENNCVFHYELPIEQQYMRNWNRDYLEFAKDVAFNGSLEPIRIHLYSPVLQGFRLAAQGRRAGKQPPEHLRARIEKHFDPLPFWSQPLEYAATDLEKYPLNAVTQRPMAMYHSWDSQNAWLRQIHSHNYLMVNPLTAKAAGVEDGGWLWVESQWGKLRCMCRYTEAVEPGTVWTWNAIGKSKSAWNLAPQADESTKGFLLNHVITEELPQPAAGAGKTISNSDPVTGQAGWYDVRVRIYPAAADEPKETWPSFAPMKRMPGTGVFKKVNAYFAGRPKTEA
ncbi:MAG TPA: molybdopterin oxidoreductase family protein, partial [Burkholderiales bacterium]|nr:molybdopterin oxidoreductase family protein [Burkholderiales bacterium]